MAGWIVVWLIAFAGAVVVVLTGWLPGSEARDIAIDRGLPVLGFLIALTVLAELADLAGVFDSAAGWCARLARGSVVRLFLLVAVLASLITIGMSLDTTAVLLTPVVLTMTARLGLAPVPFALLVVWLANTASLLLPVSNLTNLLALERSDLATTTFAARMALPELVAIVLTVAALGVLYRRDLVGTYEVPTASQPEDSVTFWVCTTACAALVPGVLLGAPPWAVATCAGGVAVAVFAIRKRSVLRFGLVPWRIVLLSVGLFMVVAAVARHGLDDLLADAAGDSSLRTAAVSAAASNLANNLPAYLAVEHAVPAHDTTQVLAVLIGTNAGPMILVWGSLATMLWRERCRARGVVISPVRFALVGLAVVPVLLVACVGALAVS